MTNPTQNNGPDGNFLAGPPMVKIDGAAVRRIREEHGLTQLYVATVVQVTTDTISRWENRRYPSIKKDNAEKLAEALGVELAALLEREEPPTAPPPPTSEPTVLTPTQEPTAEAEPPTPPNRRHQAWLVGTLLTALALALLFRFYPGSNREPLPVITATRILPAHVPPGQEFPVLVRVSAQPAASFALIVRENLPPDCRLVLASPSATGASGQADQLKWVSRLEGKERLFAYLLSSPAAAPFGSTLPFQGQVVAGGRSELTAPLSGAAQMRISPHHWADRNRDNRIDDEEILLVYDLFGDIKEFAGLRDEVDHLWTGGGYRWDGATHQYLVVKQ